MKNRTSNITTQTRVSRRGFLSGSSAGVAGLILAFTLPGGDRGDVALAEAAAAAQVNAYIKIDPDNTVTMLFGGCEFGQGTMTGFAAIVAEELRVSPGMMKVVQADASLDPVSGKANSYPIFRDAVGNAVNILYATGGSGATRGRFATLRTAGATAREMLITAAAAAFPADRSRLTAVDGYVLLDGGASKKSYGELASTAAKVPVPAVSLADPATTSFNVIGKTTRRFDIPSKTDGSAVYGIDVRLPGMWYGAVKHSPTVGGSLSATPAVPSGAAYVFPLVAETSRGAVVKGTTNAVAVLATNTWAAIQGAKALKASWKIPSSATNLDSAAITKQAADLVTTGVPLVGESVGNPDAILGAAGSKKVDVRYEFPYIPHTTMEVLNCTARYDGSSIEIWAPTQNAAGCVNTAKGITGLTADKVIVHTTALGGGLGRKIEQDYISQAVQTAKQLYERGGSGVVKLMWTREEDTLNDQFRPMALVRVQAGIDSAGAVALKYRAVSPSIRQQRQADPSIPLAAADSSSIEGAKGSRYGFAARLVEHVPSLAPAPIGFWRSVGFSFNSFALESVLDELGLAAFGSSFDPLAFRQKLLASDARALAVVNAAAALSPWRTSLPAGHAWGMAFAESFGSLVCEVVDISVPTTGGLRVHRVACAVDCGIGVNPGQIEAQMQGGIAHGLSAALWGRQTFISGVPQVKNFDKMRLLSAGEMPQVEVAVVNSGQALGGIGEPGVPPIGPAVANAYARLKGTRVRTLPFFPAAGGFGGG